ncbi:Integrase catalytic domain-containing protein, partial [Aphis craccivora]
MDPTEICISPACIINELEFLVDTGSEVNVIKIDVLRNGLTIDDTRKIYLKGIIDKNFPIRKHDNRNIILKPRTETIVSIPIAAKDVENKDIFIHRQEIKEGVFCGNIVNTVQNGEVVIKSHKIARENLIKRKIKSKQIYDSNGNSIHVKDQILLRDKTQKNKLNPLWIGPYEITDVLDRENI